VKLFPVSENFTCKPETAVIALFVTRRWPAFSTAQLLAPASLGAVLQTKFGAGSLSNCSFAACERLIPPRLGGLKA